MNKNQILTLGCVTIAGLIFIPSVIFSTPLFALIGAFFDWLPLFTGWMKTGRIINRLLLILHIVITIVAYVFFVIWIFMKGNKFVGFTFLEIWWIAVILGVLMITIREKKNNLGGIN